MIYDKLNNSISESSRTMFIENSFHFIKDITKWKPAKRKIEINKEQGEKRSPVEVRARKRKRKGKEKKIRGLNWNPAECWNWKPRLNEGNERD